MKSVLLLLMIIISSTSFAQLNVTFLSNLDPYPSDDYANVWGYVAPNGTEYALLGYESGTSIISLADAYNPVVCAFIPAPNSIWRELKVWGNYAYVATDNTGNGLQIIDLSPLPDTAILVNTLNTYFNNAHDLLIDDGYCYVVGGSAGGGMRILDLTNPVVPVLTDYYTTSGYIHDIYIWNDTVIAACGSSQEYHLIDVTDKFNPELISESISIPGIYAHSGWMTEDKRYFFGTEEFNIVDMTVWDLQDRDTWELEVASWGLNNSSIIHNLYIQGNYAHVSYYTSGYVVLDISNPLNPQIIGQYDTYPANNGGSYNGAWGVYPFLPSGNIIVSDINTGLYVLRFNPPVQTFQLSVSVNDGWNLVSIPGLHPVNQNVNTWWQFRDTNADVFKFIGFYQSVSSVIPGEGYWMNHNNLRTYNTGDEWPSEGIQVVSHDPISAAEGWNLIGGYDISAPVSGITTTPPGLISAPIYGYNAGYQEETQIVPGYGYWIRLSASGSINLPSSINKEEFKPLERMDRDWGRITITDVSGKYYTLYSVNGGVDLGKFELPPLPPAGMFDIRFASGRFAENIRNEAKVIEMSGILYPIKLKVENVSINVQCETGKELNILLKDGEEVTINNSSIKKFKVSEEIIPANFILKQNYPNPFNPVTTIEFTLPEEVSFAKLSIFNSLGEKVIDLVNSGMIAGNYSYQWDGKNSATGIYYYELRTEKFVSMKKMILIK